MVPEWLRTSIAILITIAWIVSFILDTLVKAYDPPVSITPLMLAVATWIFGAEVVAKLRNGDK